MARTVNTADAPAAGSGTGTGTLFELTFDADFAAIDVEAFAAQAMAFIDAFQFPVSVVNISGGALARGHPIGASGAILVVRLVHELLLMPAGSIGLAAIAGAGGLASCILLERV